MWKKIEESWARFKEGEPGRRFRDRYHRQQERRRSRFALSRLLYVVGGLFVMLVGVVLMLAPGPGWLVFFFGMGVLVVAAAGAVGYGLYGLAFRGGL